MLSNYFAYVISPAVCWISVVPRHVASINRKSISTVLRIGATNHDTGHLAAEAVIKQIADRTLSPRAWAVKRGWALPLGTRSVGVSQSNVRIGVAEDDLVQE